MNPFLVQHIAVPFNLLIHFAVCKRTISYQRDMIRIGILIDFKNKHGFLHTFHKKIPAGQVFSLQHIFFPEIERNNSRQCQTTKKQRPESIRGIFHRHRHIGTP